MLIKETRINYQELISDKTFLDRFWTKIQKSDKESCWLWRGCLVKGYGIIRYKGKNIRISRIILVLKLKKDLPVGKCARHTCDVRACGNPKHLIKGTRKQNTQDAVKRNRLCHGDAHWTRQHPEKVIRGKDHAFVKDPSLAARGSRNGWAKLSEEDVVKIRAKYGTGNFSQKEIAVQFDIPQQSISQIVRRVSWTHVQ